MIMDTLYVEKDTHRKETKFFVVIRDFYLFIFFKYTIVDFEH